MRTLTSALVLWAGVASAEEVSFFGGDLVLTLPDGVTIGRTFGSGPDTFAVELATPTIETQWARDGRSDEIPDMDRMEAAFGLSFPSLDCADYAENAPVLPTKCKNSIGMSILAIPQTAPDSGAQLGNQIGLLAADVDALWSAGDFDKMLTTFCDNPTHAHRVEESRDANSIMCISDRPALAPHFLSFRLILNDNYAVVMFAQNIYAETDVIMTYGVDPFLELIAGSTNIEETLFAASETYVTQNGRAQTYLLDVLGAVQ